MSDKDESLEIAHEDEGFMQHVFVQIGVLFKADEAVGMLKRLDRSMTYVSMRPLGMSAVPANNNSQNSSDVTIYQKALNTVGSLEPYRLQPKLLVSQSK